MSLSSLSLSLALLEISSFRELRLSEDALGAIFVVVETAGGAWTSSPQIPQPAWHSVVAEA